MGTYKKVMTAYGPIMVEETTGALLVDIGGGSAIIEADIIDADMDAITGDPGKTLAQVWTELQVLNNAGAYGLDDLADAIAGGTPKTLAQLHTELQVINNAGAFGLDDLRDALIGGSSKTLTDIEAVLLDGTDGDSAANILYDLLVDGAVNTGNQSPFYTTGLFSARESVGDLLFDDGGTNQTAAESLGIIADAVVYGHASNDLATIIRSSTGADLLPDMIADLLLDGSPESVGQSPLFDTTNGDSAANILYDLLVTGGTNTGNVTPLFDSIFGDSLADLQRNGSYDDKTDWAQLTAPGSTASYTPDLIARRHVLQITVANIDTNVVVRLEGSIDGSNWYAMESDATIEANGTSHIQSDNYAKHVRGTFVSELDGTAASVTLKWYGAR